MQVMRARLNQRPLVAAGVSRLVTDAVEQVTNIVEGMHATIASTALPFGKNADERTRGITGLVYGSIRLVNSAVRTSLDHALSLLPSGPLPGLPRPQWEALLAALNGVLGDYLSKTNNPLAIPMSLRRDGQALPLNATGLAAALPQPTEKLLVMAHGLCMNDRQWQRNGHNHGAALAREFGHTPLYLNYNSGRHISENGREFAELLETVIKFWPVPVSELLIVAHSMGGLVARSALHYGAEAGHAWPQRLRKLVFLGTPHHGAALERGGHWLQSMIGGSRYTAPLSRLGMLRSSGITDLRYGNLLDEDWQSSDRFRPGGSDSRKPLPLPAGVSCYALAATTGARDGDFKDRLLADGLVSLASALGQHAQAERSLTFAPANRWIGYGMNHWDLLDRPEVYAQLRHWLSVRGS